MIRFFTIIGLALLLASAPAAAREMIPQDRSAAVILTYYSIGDEQYASGSISPEQFASHIEDLENGPYTILPLPRIVEALKNGDPLPDYTMALTFDGGHASVLREAAPVLLKKNIPFTVFVATDTLDHASDMYFDQGDLKKIARNKLVTIGLHPATYARLSDKGDEEIRRQINSARARLREITGEEPRLFAYPFGEYSARYRAIVMDSGFSAAFGQQSGVAYAGADMFALPRFSMTENYSGLDRFRMTAHALPLPVTDIQPADLELTSNRPVIGFTVDAALQKQLGKLSCFVSGQEKTSIEILNSTRVEIRLDKDLEQERTRINCTLPEQTGDVEDDTRWRWFGLMLTLPNGALEDSDEEKLNLKNAISDRIEE